MNSILLNSQRLRTAVLTWVVVVTSLISGCVTITKPTSGSTPSNQVPVEIQLKSAYCNNFKVTLDSMDVTHHFTSPHNATITGVLNVGGGQHTLSATANTKQYWLLFPLCLNGYDGTDSVTFTSPGKQVVYVHSYRTNEIHQFLVQPNGTLGPLNPASFATQSPLISPLAHPNGKFFYALSSNSGTIYRWAIGADGTLASAAPALASAPTQLKSLVIDPTGRFAYLAAQGSTAGTTDIFAYSIAPDGSFSSLSPSISVSGRVSLQMQPSGHFLYAAAGGGPGIFNTIYGFSIGSNGLLSPTSQASYVASTSLSCSAFDPTGNFYYVATGTSDATQSAILQFSVSSGGSLLPLSPPSVSVPPTSASPLTGSACPVVDPKGRFVYAANGVHILNFGLNANGTLTPMGSFSSGGNGGFQVLVDKTGAFIYANHNFSNNITQFSVPTGGGAPTPLSPAIVPPIPPRGDAPTGTLVNTWVGVSLP